MSITEKLREIRDNIPPHVELVAVSKNHTVEAISEAYQAGQRAFGENKAQELADKAPLLPTDIEWHFIGHLQRNKVRLVVPYVSLIHSVDSLKLLEEINAQAEKAGRIIPCLLQFHIAEEESKFGLDINEAHHLLDSQTYRTMKNIRISGLMGMATFTEDMSQVRREFENLHAVFQSLREDYFADDKGFCELSMGMTSDMKAAIDEGSTMVRVGTAIFGER